jgi:hypothetical protein
MGQPWLGFAITALATGIVYLIIGIVIYHLGFEGFVKRERSLIVE